VFFDGEDAPNAALEFIGGDGAGDVVVIEISDPRYQARRNRLVLDAKVLGETDITSTALQQHAEGSTSEVPARFGPAALYIDDASACPATYWTFSGELRSLAGISCTTAQQVVAAATAAHPENDGSGQYVYDFLFATELWNATDQLYQAVFERTDHDVQQSFEWTCTAQQCTGGGGGNPGEEPE